MVGIKPTVGLVSRAGTIPLAHSFDTAGPITRDVTDAAALLSAVTGYDGTDVINTPSAGRPSGPVDYTRYLSTHALEGARIGYSSQDMPSGAAGAVWQQALGQLKADGATLVEVAPAFDPNNPDVSSVDNLPTEGNLSIAELANIPEEFHNNLDTYLATEAGPEGTAPGDRPVLTTDDLTGIIAYNQGYPNQVKYGQSLLITSDANDGATQTDPGSAATIVAARHVIDTSLSHYGLSAYVAPDASYAGSGAAAGYPSITVPDGYTPDATLGQDAHGMQFLGTAYSEPTLIGMAYAYEQSSHLRTPATVADPAITANACATSPTANTPEAPVAVGGFLVVVLRRSLVVLGDDAGDPGDACTPAGAQCEAPRRRPSDVLTQSAYSDGDAPPGDSNGQPTTGSPTWAPEGQRRKWSAAPRHLALKPAGGAGHR